MINALTKSNYKLQNEYYSRNRTEQNRTTEEQKKLHGIFVRKVKGENILHFLIKLNFIALP